MQEGSVASLCSSAVVAGAPLVIYPLRTRHHDASYHHQSTTERTTSTITRLPQSGQPPQPVCHRADDLLYHNQRFYYNLSAAEQTTSYIQSIAIVLQTTSTTTSLRLSRYRQLNYRRLKAYRRRTADNALLG